MDDEQQKYAEEALEGNDLMGATYVQGHEYFRRLGKFAPIYCANVGHKPGECMPDLPRKGTSMDRIPLWEQVEWLLQHINDATSPYPQLVNDSEIRAKLVVRFVLAYGEHGDDLFRKTQDQHREDKIDEWVDGELYGIAEKYACEMHAPPDPYVEARKQLLQASAIAHARSKGFK